MGGSKSELAPVESCSLDRAGTVEQRFGLLGCTVSGRMRECAVLTGSHAATDEGVAGVLAVLSDHVLGEVANHPQPPGLLPVTTSLSLDVLCAPPSTTEPLVARARQIGAGGGYVRAEIGAAGRALVASAAAWMTHVPARGLPPLAAGPAVGAEVPAPPVADVLDVQTDFVADDGRAGGRFHALAWTNQNGTLHGGVGACAAVLLAERLLGRQGTTYRTSHLDVAYLRPLGPVEVELRARILHRGRRSGMVQVLACDGEGRAGLAVTVIARTRSGRDVG
ncbi:hypothetical protein AD006_31790 (plasmid) [Pseudonocardia sp. EC080610-09]|uniref:hotdog domain-containing protein n=1 Tax=unclassified Pseudonocardia TaxID=2619320 RepID=UPI0007069A6B|nr:MULTISPECIES: hotdog domain-containing protein [unclassified Pseudonocardia]ALL79722.1 hypothetical protein AD006_31790 [Pseudonocardia sp. EC080610-09]ALL85154.1 hypothetical protein AD017_28315 [Pseudonocardia sp. EC080619-01]